MSDQWRRFSALRAQMGLFSSASREAGFHDDWEFATPLRQLWAPAAPRLIVYLTKSNYLETLRRRFAPDSWPPAELQGVAWLGRFGLVTRGVARQVAEMAGRLRAPIVFLGDLDPFDLMTWLSLNAQLARHGLEPRYGGLRGSFFDRLRGHWNVHGYWIELSRFERQCWRLLRRQPECAPQVVGQEAHDLLEQGLKLELEATMWHWAEARAEFAAMLHGESDSGN